MHRLKELNWGLSRRADFINRPSGPGQCGYLRPKVDGIREERVCPRMGGGDTPYLQRKILAALGTQDRAMVRKEPEGTRGRLGKD